MFKPTKMSKLLKLIIISISLFSASAYATLNLELTQGISSAIPLAIIPFSGQEQIASDDKKTSLVVSNDLKNSGQFRLVDSSAASNNDEINYDTWRQQKLDNVITGNVTKISDNQYRVSFKLFDVYNKNKLIDEQFTVPSTKLRPLAHHISDLVYHQLTGYRGIFSTKIAYILVQRSPDRPTIHKLEVSDMDGYNPHTLLTSKFPIMSPSWSPDGKQIAYVSFEGNRAAIYIQEVATGQRKVISKFPGINGAPAWSPDGKKMAVVLTNTGYPKIYILDLASKQVTRITTDWFLDTEPSFTPDGNSIVFTSNRDATPQIYRVNLSSKKVDRITYDGPYNARASFTPDGKSLVMLHQDSGMFTIAVQDLSSGRVTALTRSGSGMDESPSVAPNGKMIVYATNANDRGVLAEVSIDGQVKLLLPEHSGEVQEPSWSPFLSR